MLHNDDIRFSVPPHPVTGTNRWCRRLHSRMLMLAIVPASWISQYGESHQYPLTASVVDQMALPIRVS
jgi:hypothetical protein